MIFSDMTDLAVIKLSYARCSGHSNYIVA